MRPAVYDHVTRHLCSVTVSLISFKKMQNTYIQHRRTKEGNVWAQYVQYISTLTLVSPVLSPKQSAHSPINITILLSSRK